jgi:hypothetical protein
MSAVALLAALAAAAAAAHASDSAAAPATPASSSGCPTAVPVRCFTPQRLRRAYAISSSHSEWRLAAAVRIASTRRRSGLPPLPGGWPGEAKRRR